MAPWEYQYQEHPKKPKKNALFDSIMITSTTVTALKCQVPMLKAKIPRGAGVVKGEGRDDEAL